MSTDFELSIIKSELDRQQVSTESIDLSKLRIDIDEAEQEIAELDRRLDAQSALFKLLQDEGIKGSVISSIVPVMNAYLDEYLTMMRFRYSVRMTDDFSAVVVDGAEEIDTDQLSEGEDKIINIALMFSYLSVIRAGGMVNVLFIDEIFSYIDLDNIGLILSFLREWKERFDTHVIIVNHQIPGEQFFDRVLRVERDYHSYIVEE